MSTTTDIRQWPGLKGRGIDLLLPSPPPATAPKAVVKASEHAAKMFSAYEASVRAVRSAKAELAKSAALDKAADSAALALGKPLPSARLQAAAQNALVASQRRQEAATGAWEAAKADFLTAITDHLDEWLADQGNVVEAQRQTLRDLLDDVRREYGRLTVETSTLDSLERLSSEQKAYSVDFGRRDDDTMQRQQAQREEKMQRARKLAEQGLGGSIVRGDLDELLNHLRLMVDPAVRRRARL